MVSFIIYIVSAIIIYFPFIVSWKSAQTGAKHVKCDKKALIKGTA